MYKLRRHTNYVLLIELWAYKLVVVILVGHVMIFIHRCICLSMILMRTLLYAFDLNW